MLQTRVGEHRSHIRRNSTQLSVITDHRLQAEHEFDWGYVKVLDQESNYNERLISEMIYIKKQKHGLNAQTDTALLDPIYSDLFGTTSLRLQFPFYYLFIYWFVFICEKDVIYSLVFCFSL